MRTMKRLLRLDFVRFCIVGGLGFVLNFILLTLLYKILSLPLFIAQLIAGEIALFSNFMLHHHWTYKHMSIAKSVGRLLVEFHVTSWVAIVGTAAIVTFGVNGLDLQYVIALFVAGVIALFWNFIWSKYVIWKHHTITEGSGDTEHKE